jgi:hypothetical protein
MDPSYTEAIPMDENDPIYDAAEDSKYILSSSSIDQGAEKRGYDPGTSKAVYGPMLTSSEFKLQLAVCIHEYYDSCDADEVIRTLEELGCKEYHSEIVKKAISLALDKSSRERELTSRLLTCLHPTPMTMEEMETGFVNLLDSLYDLTKDVPDAEVSHSLLPTQSQGCFFSLELVCYRFGTLSSIAPLLLLFSRQLLHHFWQEPLWTRCCPLPFCRNKTTTALAMS